MNSIEIEINNIGNKQNIYIDTIENKIIINNIKKNIEEDKIKDLLRIIRTWDHNYIEENNQIDNEKFLIKINTNEGIDVVKGEGKYPHNYNSFKEWIGELYE